MVRLGPGGEFDAIREMVRRWGAVADRGLGDDAAIFEARPGEKLVVTVDTAVDGVHFLREWMSPAEIGYRAAAAAASDIAAMGASPLGILAALCVPSEWRDLLGEIAEGIGALASSIGAPILGGNLSAGRELSITTTVIGSAAHPVRRDTSRPGDRIYVTGRLGGPGAALRALAGRSTAAPEHQLRLIHPEPRIGEGIWLRAEGATAMIDVSDGLAADLAHIAHASGVSLEIRVESVPVLAGIKPMDALASGEEFELIVTGPGFDTAKFERTFGLPLTEIGVVSAGPASVRATLNGTLVDLPRGHDHFSR